jgi:hypothetical protein
MLLILGSWLVGTVLVGVMAAENFWIIDRLLRSPSPALQRDVVQLPPGEARVLLRHLASELNRFWFETWGWIELALAATLLIMALRTRPRPAVLTGLGILLAITIAMAFYLTPQIIAVGRPLDFVPREPAPPALAKFGRLHAAYSILDLGKLLIGIWMAVIFVRSGPD